MKMIINLEKWCERNGMGINGNKGKVYTLEQNQFKGVVSFFNVGTVK
jgi:hypothetical protein